MPAPADELGLNAILVVPRTTSYYLEMHSLPNCTGKLHTFRVSMPPPSMHPGKLSIRR